MNDLHVIWQIHQIRIAHSLSIRAAVIRYLRQQDPDPPAYLIERLRRRYRKEAAKPGGIPDKEPIPAHFERAKQARLAKHQEDLAQARAAVLAAYEDARRIGFQVDGLDHSKAIFDFRGQLTYREQEAHVKVERALSDPRVSTAEAWEVETTQRAIVNELREQVRILEIFYINRHFLDQIRD